MFSIQSQQNPYDIVLFPYYPYGLQQQLLSRVILLNKPNNLHYHMLDDYLVTNLGKHNHFFGPDYQEWKSEVEDGIGVEVFDKVMICVLVNIGIALIFVAVTEGAISTIVGSSGRIVIQAERNKINISIIIINCLRSRRCVRSFPEWGPDRAGVFDPMVYLTSPSRSANPHHSHSSPFSK